MADITRGRRDELLQVRAPNNTHPGLWLDRYLTLQTWKRAAGPAPDGYDSSSAKQAKELLITTVAGRPVATGYPEAFKRWKDGFVHDAETPPRVAMVETPSIGRVLIGSGAKGAGEFGITLHHTWGVPVLPGSSLKGIAALGADRYFADPTWRCRSDPARPRDGEPNAYDALFGTVEETAAVIFHDAWLVPSGRPPQNGLYRDVLTVHHPDYYQQDGELSDSEDPIPVPFVSASGTFLVVLELAPELDPMHHLHWLKSAWQALRRGLDRHGVGAKTNASYGRFKLPSFDKLPAMLRWKEIGEIIKLRREREALESGELIDHVLKREGEQTLKDWLLPGGAEKVIGLEPDSRDDLLNDLPEAIWVTLRGNSAAPTSGEVRAELKELVKRLENTRQRISDEELATLIRRHSNRRGIKGDKFVDALLTLNPDADLLIRAKQKVRGWNNYAPYARKLNAAITERS